MAFTVISSGTTTQTVNDTDIFTLTAGGTLSASGNAIEIVGGTLTEATVNILGSVIAGRDGVDAFLSLAASGAPTISPCDWAIPAVSSRAGTR